MVYVGGSVERAKEWNHQIRMAQHTDQFTSIKYNDGFKGQSESMTDFLYDFITLCPLPTRCSSQQPHGRNNTRFDIKK